MQDHGNVSDYNCEIFDLYLNSASHKALNCSCLFNTGICKSKAKEQFKSS